MSIPARDLPQPQPRSRPAGEPIPAGRPRSRPASRPATRPEKASPPQRRARRGSHRGFWILSALLVTGLLLGQVVLSGFLVNTTYRMHAVRDRLDTLSEEHDDLSTRVAELSSPDRIAQWARGRGLVMPDPGDVIVIPIPGTSIAGDAGSGPGSATGTGEGG